MFSRTPRGGHRPAENLTFALPPTLQPHAIAAMAPALDRRTSALLSGLVYLGLAGGLFLLGRATHVIAPPKDWINHGPVTLEADAHKPPVQAHVDTKPLQRVAKGSGTRPADAPTYIPSQNQISDATSSELPTTDMSRAYDASLPVGAPGQENTGGNPNGTDTVGSHEGAPVNVDLTALHILNQVTPIYPPMAKLAHIQGDVVLHMVIDAR
ncbi:MAG TPA: hypothetical protein VJ483_00035, partial [Holophagaceae bacterium]|nr:hypothetical protein [Holophagaceae bacterium]